MKCEACKEYDKKLEEVRSNYFGHALDAHIGDLKINRCLDCTCGGAKKAANEALNSQMSTTETISKQQAEERASRESKHTPAPWNTFKLFNAIGVQSKQGLDLCYTKEPFNEERPGLNKYDTSRSEEESLANATRIVACVNACEGISNRDLLFGVLSKNFSAKILPLPVGDREKELNLIFEQLDVLDVSEEVRAILLRMRTVFNENYPPCKITGEKDPK